MNNAVEMKNISMIFNKKIVANKNVNFTVKKGEIHALIGENGAGKSTLMSILFGIYQPTQGSIFINEKEQIISSPVKANLLKIGMVHQHFKLVDIFPLWKNIILGSETVKFREFIDKKKTKEKLNSLMNQYNLNIDLDALALDATVGTKQKAEILKILYKDADILVFDEPTAMLAPEEIKGLLKIIKNLKASGKTIIFISHKMKEIQEIADRATVIRRGECIGTYDVKKTSISELSKAMVGREIVEVKNDYTKPNDEVILEINNLNVKKTTHNKVLGLLDFNLSIKSGEIVGICGVEGNGQNELVDAITGMVKPKSGEIKILNKIINHSNINKRYKKHLIRHIPEDRQKYGLVLDENIINNSVLQDIDDQRFNSNKILNFSAMQAYAQELVEKFDVRNADAGFAITRELSGGNQQKIILGRELSSKNKLIVIFQPTRGLDIGSIEYIHSQILKAKAKGSAILLVSYELSEIMSLSDRIVVLNSGKKIAEVQGKGAKIEKIGKLMMGEV